MNRKDLSAAYGAGKMRLWKPTDLAVKGRRHENLTFDRIFVEFLNTGVEIFALCV